MKWLETIFVQAGGGDEKNAENQLRELASTLPTNPDCSGLAEAEIYRHASIRGDFALQLLWKTNQPQSYGSPTGLGLKEVMKKYGLVDHKVWIQMKEEDE